METKQIEVDKLPDGCRGHIFLGYQGCPFCTVIPNTENPEAYCKWDDKKTNLIMMVGGRLHNCPLVEKKK